MATRSKTKSIIIFVVSVIISVFLGYISYLLCHYPIDNFDFESKAFVFGGLAVSFAAVFAICVFDRHTVHGRIPEIAFLYVLYYLSNVIMPTLNTAPESLTNKHWLVFQYFFRLEFEIIMLPISVVLSFFFIFYLKSLVSLIYLKKLSEKSVIMRSIRFLMKGKSIRRKFLIEIFLAELISGAFLIAYIYILAFYGNLINNNGWLLLLVPAAFNALILILIFVRKGSAGTQIEQISDAVVKSSEGDFPKENPLLEQSIFYETGEALVKLGKLTEDGIQKGIAGEKLKVELITNVSHDIRTPLTSIIGYSEQLERCDLGEENNERVRVITHKAKYLSEMVNDLFDLSKTASGNIEMQLADIDIHTLIGQTLAEMHDKAESCGAQIKLRQEADSTVVNTDGFRLHRVVQNLIDNALKYYLKDTRIFISTKNVDDTIVISIINTSSYEMDFTGMDITDRFTRGDSSRSGEGSGIGLAIAKTYTEAIGGTFDININGDQFEAVLKFPIVKAKEN